MAASGFTLKITLQSEPLLGSVNSVCALLERMNPILALDISPEPRELAADMGFTLATSTGPVSQQALPGGEEPT